MEWPQPPPLTNGPSRLPSSPNSNAVSGKPAHLNPKNGPRPKLQPHDELVAKTPDATLEEIREQLPVQVCPQTVSNALIRLKLVYKKTTPRLRTESTGHRSKTGPVESDATQFGPEKAGVFGRDGDQNEHDTALSIGQRLIDRVPQGHWLNTTYICGLRHNRIVAPHTFVGAMNAERFVHSIETIA